MWKTTRLNQPRPGQETATADWLNEFAPRGVRGSKGPRSIEGNEGACSALCGTGGFDWHFAKRGFCYEIDRQLQHDVCEELEWDPSVTAGAIGVSVTNGVVTLTGTVPTYAEKCAAEQVARRVAGVHAIAAEIQVKPSGIHKRNDTEVAETVDRSLRSHVWVPTDVQATVDNGWVTLSGEVTWEFQRQAAADAVRFLSGVRGVRNKITILPRESDAAVEDAIAQALKRNADVEAERMTIAARGGKVTLSGQVRTFAERDGAERVAWSAPGVSAVDNQLVVLW